METSSEYTFPIFISSTDYNLKDLRAELARFLSELGYRPILSSAEGFPDSSPSLEPWESCLPVLDKCFVMVLIIDGKYGTALKWTNFKDCFEDKKLAPTHAEYIYAHKARKRMLVFIRKALMPHYQSYRTTIENCGGDKEKAKVALSLTLPEYVSFEALDFINEVKTTKPIPWINEFDDITSVKKEIQKKMLNELAELFLIKNKHFETVIDSFNKVMDSLSLEEQKKALTKINATKEITDAVNRLEEYKKDLEKTKEELGKAKSSSNAEKEKFEKKIEGLNKKISELEKETRNSNKSQFFLDNGQVKIGNPSFLEGGYVTHNPGVTIGGVSLGGQLYPTASYMGRKCDNCGKHEDSLFTVRTTTRILGQEFNTCPSCKRYLCSDCWPRYGTMTTYRPTPSFVLSGQDKKCPRCVGEEK